MCYEAPNCVLDEPTLNAAPAGYWRISAYVSTLCDASYCITSVFVTLFLVHQHIFACGWASICGNLRSICEAALVLICPTKSSLIATSIVELFVQPPPGQDPVTRCPLVLMELDINTLFYIIDWVGVSSDIFTMLFALIWIFSILIFRLEQLVINVFVVNVLVERSCWCDFLFELIMEPTWVLL